MRKTVHKYAKFIVTVHESARFMDSTVHKSVSCGLGGLSTNMPDLWTVHKYARFMDKWA